MAHIEDSSYITRSVNTDDSWRLGKTMNQQDGNLNAMMANTGAAWCPVSAATDSENKKTTQSNHPLGRKGGIAYIQYMEQIYSKAAATWQPNHLATSCQLPANLRSSEWEALIRSPEDGIIVDCLKFGFLAGYQGPIPTPAEGNHVSARLHPGDISTYITK